MINNLGILTMLLKVFQYFMLLLHWLMSIMHFTTLGFERVSFFPNSSLKYYSSFKHCTVSKISTFWVSLFSNVFRCVCINKQRHFRSQKANDYTQRSGAWSRRFVGKRRWRISSRMSWTSSQRICDWWNNCVWKKYAGISEKPLDDQLLHASTLDWLVDFRPHSFCGLYCWYFPSFRFRRTGSTKNSLVAIPTTRTTWKWTLTESPFLSVVPFFGSVSCLLQRPSYIIAKMLFTIKNCIFYSKRKMKPTFKKTKKVESTRQEKQGRELIQKLQFSANQTTHSGQASFLISWWAGPSTLIGPMRGWRRNSRYTALLCGWLLDLINEFRSP